MERLSWYADERVKAVLRGIRRTIGVAPRRMTPATAERVIAMAPPADGNLMALRDRALLLLGFAGAFRRSELVTLDVTDIEEVAEGLRVTIRRGKLIRKEVAPSSQSSEVKLHAP